MYYLLCLWLLNVLCKVCCASELYPRVYDGQDLRPFIHKYLVHLRNHHIFMNNGSQYLTFCSGSILNQRWIISAAHCFHHNIVYVEVEKRSLQTLGYVDKDQITSHPGFVYNNPATYLTSENDLALLKTSKAMKFDTFTMPIGLSTQTPKIGETIIVAGYGNCERGLSVPREGSTVITKCTSETKAICTRSTVRAGSEDSGGPLVSRGRLVGVTSSGCQEEEVHKPCETVYVDVASHLNWIKQVVLKHSRSE